MEDHEKIIALVKQQRDNAIRQLLEMEIGMSLMAEKLKALEPAVDKPKPKPEK